MKLFPLQEAFVKGTERAQRTLQGLLSSVERQCTCQLFFACPITLTIYFRVPEYRPHPLLIPSGGWHIERA